MLVDRQIREYVLEDKLIGIEPFREEALQPASYDLHLGYDFQIFRPSAGGQFLLDLAQPQENCWKTVLFQKTVEAADGSGREIPAPLGSNYLDLEPGGFVLATTEEVIDLPWDIVARVEGKSSLGRSGLLVHVTAGFIDPGFNGEITLELKNLLPVPMRIYPGMPIAQLSFLPTYNDASAQSPYTGKYHGQSGATVSQFWRNF